MNKQDSINRPLTDEQLLLRYRQGQKDAFGLLIERYQSRLFNAVFRMVNNYDDALELTQDAFVRALQGAGDFRGQAGFYTWLFRIGINLCINFRRRQTGKVRFCSLGQGQVIGHQADALLNLVDRRGSAPAQQAQTNEMHQLIVDALQLLDPAGRAVVVLRDIEGLDYAEIAVIMDLPVGTVKSKLFRAHLHLRELLKTRQQQTRAVSG